MELDASHCSRWMGIKQSRLQNHHRIHIEILVTAMKTGPWNIPVKWENAEFGPYHSSFALNQSLATADFDYLTRLVLAAHEKSVRIEISPCSPRHIRVSMWSRERHQEGMGFHKGHPTIEQAIARFESAPPQ